MWANSCWGFLGLAVTFFLARLSMMWTTGHEEWGPRLEYMAVICSVLTVGFFLWPQLKKMFSPWNIRRLVTLNEAATEALDSVEGSVFAHAARRPFIAPHGALSYVATNLFLNETPMYGKRVPSAKLRPMPDDLLFANEFADNATIVRDTFSQEITYIDIVVKRNDLKKAIASLKKRHPPTN